MVYGIRFREAPLAHTTADAYRIGLQDARKLRPTDSELRVARYYSNVTRGIVRAYWLGVRRGA